MTDNQKTQIMKLRAVGKGYGSIAQSLGISLNTVKSYCRRNTIKGEMAVVSSVEFTGETSCCENCGQEIRQIAKRKRKRFCCDKCRNEWWNKHLDQVKRKAIYEFRCPHCGRAFQSYGDKRRKSCSHECYIADRFKGGAANA